MARNLIGASDESNRMLPLLFFANSPLERLHTESTAPKADAKFLILSYSPTSIKTSENEVISLIINTTINPPVFCRFEYKVLYGKVLNETTVLCRPPKLSSGLTTLSLSTDRRRWCAPVSVEVIGQPRSYRWVFLIILAVFALSIGALFVRKPARWRRWRRRHTRRKTVKEIL